jgi:hypothetical protein
MFVSVVSGRVRGLHYYLCVNFFPFSQWRVESPVAVFSPNQTTPG